MSKSSNKTILLVDDDSIISLFWKMNLEKLGYNIFTVYNGASAVSIVRSEPCIDLILMDIDLGKGIDGIDASIEILKSREIPIVFVSSHTELEIIQKTEQVTSYGYIVKNSDIAVYDASIKMAFKLFSEKRKSMKIEKVLKTSLDHLNRAVFISDENAKIIQFNNKFAEIQGYACKDECIEKLEDYPEVFDVFTVEGEFARLDEWALSRALRGETRSNVKYYIKRKDIMDVWIGYYSFAPIYDDDLSLIGAIVIIDRDPLDYPDDPIMTRIKQIIQKWSSVLRAVSTIIEYMDNRSLLIALDIVLLNSALFALIIGGRIRTSKSAWQISSILSMCGFFLLSFQSYLPSWVTIIIANFLILIGHYAQVLAALQINGCADRVPRFYLQILIALYLILYLYFTYFSFNTAVRVIIISAFIALNSGYGAALLISQSSRENRRFTFHVNELVFLFIVTALFFIFRVCVTVLNGLTMSSLIEPNLYNSISFLFTILQHLIFFMGMATTSLRKKNNLLQIDKERFQYLFSFLKDTAMHLEIADLYRRIEEILTQTLGLDSGGIFLFDDERKGLNLAHQINYLELDTSGVQYLERGNGLVWKAIEGDEVVAVDASEYPDTPFGIQMKRKGIKYIAAAPLKTANGIIGGMTALFTSKESNLVMDRDFFYYLGEQIGLVLHNALMYSAVSSIAHRDMLTGLYTRRKFFEILSIEANHSKRHLHTFCLAMADIDHFKQVNDSSGHDCGDRILQAAASIFIRECRDTDYICRWGGEEFMFLFLDTEINTALPITERVRAAFEQYTCDCPEPVKTTISIGLTQSNPELSLEELIKKADELLYDAKRSGRNRVVSGLPG